jgi:hypothetical protein
MNGAEFVKGRRLFGSEGGPATALRPRSLGFSYRLSVSPKTRRMATVIAVAAEWRREGHRGAP